MKLFDDVGGSDGEIENIQIDPEFARRYEHNKKREDLQRLAELQKKGIVNSESDSDGSSSSGDELIDGRKELFDALIRVRNQDPSLKDKEARLFASDSDSDSDNGDDEKLQKKEKKKKPLHLKDVIAKQLIEEGPEFSSEVVEKSNVEKLEELRQETLKSIKEQDGEDEGELLTEKKGDGDNDEVVEKLDEYFGPDEQLDEQSVYLRDFFRNKMWENKDGVKVEVGISEDEEEIEKQEEYEKGYNFRFEENAGDRVLGYSRVVEGSVRKVTNTRKLQRQRKEERIALAEAQRKEELKHLKNVKKKEINEKIRKIRETAGIDDDGDFVLEVDDLDGEFDPDEHDKKMKKAFDDSYYGADDVDPDFGSEDEKPDFDKEDELLGLSKGWDDVEAPSDGFLSVRERILKQKEGEDNHEAADGEEEDGKRKKKGKRKLSEVETAVNERLMEEYHKLDYEGTIGELKTRFKYKDVKPRKYGLNLTEIITMDDKELNQYVPLKKLAPYREKEWKVPANIRKQMYSNASKVTKTDKHEKMGSAEKPSSSVSENQEMEKNSGSSRRVRRKLRQAEQKLPLNRLMAYGKIPNNKPKEKKKPKH